MGKYEDGILGTFTGKVGPVVGLEWNGRRVMRAYSATARNPRTPRQQLHRARFALAGRLSRQLAGSYHVGLKLLARSRKSTPSAEFTRLNMSALVGDDPAALHVEWARVQLSCGPLSLPTFDAPQREADGLIRVGMQVDTLMLNDLDRQFDWVLLTAYCTDCEASTYATTARRRDLTARILLPADFEGHTVQLFAFMVGSAAENVGLTSPTAYLGEV